MLSILFAACSTGTSAVAPLQDNGLQPDGDITIAVTPGPELALPEASACDWPGDDPHDVVTTGNEPGDIVADMILWDQCGERLSMHDFFGRYVLVLSTTDACADCDPDAAALADEAAGMADRAGVEVLPVVVLADPDASTPPAAAASYADRLGLKGFPVTADPAAVSLDLLPLDGRAGPGRCLLAPDMEILGCADDVDWALVIEDWIETDAADG